MAAEDGLELPKFSDGDHSEFEVQANLFRALTELGLKVRGELTVRGKKKDSRTRRTREMVLNPSGRWQCRFDLVIYDGEDPVHIVEIKGRRKTTYAGVPYEQKSQEIRYRQFGLPVTFVYGMEGAREFLVEMARQYLKVTTL